MSRHGKQAGQQAAGRAIALVIAATAVFWIAATWAGGRFGWPAGLRMLMDVLALAGFAWALIRTFRLWRTRKDEG